MSTHQKLNARQTEITNLKRLWRDDLAEGDRDYWREQFESSRSPAELRREIQEKYNLTLRHDTQLKRFRNWVTELDAMEEIKERAAEDLAELEQEGLTPGQLRDELLRRMQARALVHGDFNLALKAIAAGVKVETLQLAREKFKAAYQTKVKAGLRCLGQEIRGNPAAQAAFDAFCAIVEPDDDTTPKPVEPNRSAGLRPGSLDAAATPTQPAAPEHSENETQSNPACRAEAEGVGGSNPVKPTPEPVSPEPSRSVTPASPLGAPASLPSRLPGRGSTSATARPTCSPNPTTPIAPQPSESNPIKPTSASENLVSTHNVPANNPSIQKSINPSAPAPASNPKEEYETRLWRMQHHFEPYDEPTLLSLYYAIPIDQR